MANQNKTTKLRKDLDSLISDYEATQEENKHLKTLLYRMVATHGNEIEPVGYLPRKGAKIHEMRVFMGASDTVSFDSPMAIRHIPNNSEAEV
jgi:hypothetical protein